MTEEWIIFLPGEAPAGGGNPHWKRFRRADGATTQADIEYFLAERLGDHAAARATRGNVEITYTRRSSSVITRIEA
jgi:hypothetical protein